MKIDKRYKWGGLSKFAAAVVSWHGWGWKTVKWPVSLLMFCSLLWVSIMPMEVGEQLVFALGVLSLVLYMRRYAGSFITLAMLSLSVILSTRYLYWRGAETLNFSTWLNASFSIGLYVSEGYAWLVLVLGYFQTLWPLNRRVTPLPADAALWPTVDVLITTYNEPLSVVRTSVLAATMLDWPAKKLKVYILDDGNRPEFAAFAKEAGVGYVTRTDNQHAKAGNLNNAFKYVAGEYVAIFDCDHVPVRSFLQVGMGGFLQDPKLALVQTPHHFLSPDPFERNLDTFRHVPNEGALFYGLVQEGNDLWNAAFFCGSCAILKRAALDDIGGIATGTVTEDAHTSLRLHRKGYNSAYLNIVQAAGLATESLGAHIKQRMRWARGMVQIFRMDCPLLGKGLTLAQRFCYTNAILHFMYGFPRMFFLLSPLAYMFFGAYIINAPAGVILIYALPHLMLAFMVNSRLQGHCRHSFWSEVYETVLAWYILWPALIAMISPKKGQFNVTAKGGLIHKEYFDWKIGMPYVVVLLLLISGLLVGILRLVFINAFEWDTVVLNGAWLIYNLIMVLAALAVAFEVRQIRKGWRTEREIPAVLSFISMQAEVSHSQELTCHTRDYSDGGVALVVPEGTMLKAKDIVSLRLYRGEIAHDFTAEVVGLYGKILSLRFNHVSLAQERSLIEVTLSRADAWLAWVKVREEADHPLRDFKGLIGYSWLGWKRFVSASHNTKIVRSKP
ncbi:MAG: hypothetical protein RL358_33 [Pseudomonadota bacterium]